MQLEVIILSEVSQKDREGQIAYDITSVWNLKCDTNELIYKTKTDTRKGQICGCWAEGGPWEGDGLGVWGW